MVVPLPLALAVVPVVVAPVVVVVMVVPAAAVVVLAVLNPAGIRCTHRLIHAE